MPGTITTWPHYQIMEITSMEEVREIFPEPQANALNWLLCSTSGVHGSYATLDELDHPELDFDGEDLANFEPRITVLIIQPRLVCLHYGDIEVTPEDRKYLRALVRTSLDYIPISQEGNT